MKNMFFFGKRSQKKKSLIIFNFFQKIQTLSFFDFCQKSKQHPVTSISSCLVFLPYYPGGTNIDIQFSIVNDFLNKGWSIQRLPSKQGDIGNWSLSVPPSFREKERLFMFFPEMRMVMD